MGWAHRRRDHGAVIFIDMRDRTGHAGHLPRGRDPAVHKRAEEVRAEYVIAVEGVECSPPKPSIPTSQQGEVEVAAEDLDPQRIPNSAVPHGRARRRQRRARLKYRYVDLRRPQMQRNIILRSKIAFAVRQ